MTFNYLTIISLEQGVALNLNKFESPILKKTLYISWNWSSVSGEEDDYVKCLRRRRKRPCQLQREDKCRPEKLKMTDRKYGIRNGQCTHYSSLSQHRGFGLWNDAAIIMRWRWHDSAIAIVRWWNNDIYTLVRSQNEQSVRVK